MPDRAVIWLCVSTDEQADPKRTSLDTQLDACKRACDTAGDLIVGVLRPPSEEGFSRFYSRLDQMIAAYPPYRQLVELIDSEAVTKVVALRYDRLWRTAALATQLSALAEEHDVWLFSVEEPTSREGWTQNAWLRMIHSVQPEEAVRRLAADRRRGMAGRAERGLPVASTRPYGYLLVGRGKDRRLEPCPDERPVVELIMRLRAAGHGSDWISKALQAAGIPAPRGNGWTRKAIRYICANPVYAGYIRARLWPRRPKAPRRGPPEVHLGRGRHEPLISDELWAAVERVNEMHRRDYARRDRPCHLLTGLCRCGLCGSPMSYHRYPTSQAYFLVCSRNKTLGGCTHNGHSERALRAYLTQWLAEALRDPERWARTLDSADSQQERLQRVASLEQEIAGLELRCANLLAGLELVADTAGRAALIDRYEALLARREQLVDELSALRQIGVGIDAARRRFLAWEHVAEDLPQWTDAQLRPLLLQLIHRIVLRRGEEPEIVVAGTAR